MSQKERKTGPFFVFNKNFEVLALSIITCARQEVTLLSEELLYTRMARSTLSSLPLLCTLVYTEWICCITVFASLHIGVYSQQQPQNEGQQSTQYKCMYMYGHSLCDLRDVT